MRPSAKEPAEGARIRDVGPGDLGAVAAILAHYVLHTAVTFDEVPPTPEEWRERVAHYTGLGLPFLVAEVGGRVVGYAYASPWRPKAAYRLTVEETIYLDPAWTGRGLGRPLLRALLDRCAAAGLRQAVAVIVDSEAPASVALHRSVGFRPVGRLTGVGYKHGRPLDTLLLQCELAAD
ncbi:GNAT family N-acetyltransferase [Allonocardiopsis opalescens]|uniref:Phosphinothricin acetyltransferase n=1 Tax=Allonocardiopsis opalescens TaxID=1144618 RepID=A0A2T0Q1X1_9ACTN|nr:GNAT family N-acetyltransferase [Allonocardiopsis opalescens]PRX97796.1 phosphinothricin acetyltransferase [Allonocardiopsis opalescens]